MTEYKSRFAEHMNDMVEYRVALGYSEKTYAPRLVRFDRFIVEKHSAEKQLSKALVMDWITRRNAEGASTIQNRAAIARLFAEYLTSVGYDAYDTEWLEAIMKSCFRRANANIEEENLPRVRVYDLRHRFASAVLCKWLDEGKNLYNMLPYLRTYMGHSSLSETAYYIHILPENLLKSKGIEWDRLDAVIPEDDIWGE